MILQKGIFLHLSTVLLFSAFQGERVEGVRLCGRRLADLLNFICDRHGGFHAPRDRRTVSTHFLQKRAVIEILRPLNRRTDPKEWNAETGAASMEGTSPFQQGIVDECCKKQCTVSTLASYCANTPQQAGETDLQEMFPAGTLDEPTLSDDDLSELEYQRITSGSSAIGSATSDQRLSEIQSASSYPNLGLSNRNRPVFIVLSQTQEDEK